MPRIDTLLREGADLLRRAEVPSPAFDARELLLFAAGFSRETLLLRESVDDDTAGRYTALLARRAERYPLQYLIGFWEFYGRRFSVREGVLIPRPETECLVEAALELPLPAGPVLDLCSGSGVLGVTLALECSREADAVELSDEAFPVLEENLVRYPAARVNAVRGDVCVWKPSRRYALIVSNPPYLRREDFGVMQPEIRFEPEMALAAGEDGLFFYQVIARRFPQALVPGGWLILESGAGQAQEIASLLRGAGMKEVSVRKDYAGIGRVVMGHV